MMILLHCADKCNLPAEGELGVGQQGFDENVLDERDTGVDMDVFDVEGVQMLLSAMHHTTI
jgi:folate-dependent tRNA-U54 methylase TrmFO/GidA